jgi:tellurite resistance protein TehA-like permease
MTVPDRSALRRILAPIPPASGAVVMGTGIVSIGLSLDGHETLSRSLLAIDCVVWVVLGLLLAARVAVDPTRARREARSPAGLTGVAGTAVLGTRLTLLGWTWVGTALLALTLGFWLLLLGPVLRSWKTPTVGVSLVLAVSTQSLAVLAATLAASADAAWLLDVALAPFLLGLAFYVFVIARFDLRQVLVGHGDHWVTGGALAISALAAGRITIGAQSLGALGGLTGTLEGVCVGLWIAAIAWLPVLVVAEALRPRLGYDVRRWSTVFPVGMYAACSFVVGTATGDSPITDFARVWIWVAVSVWTVVFAALLKRVVQAGCGEHPPLHPRRMAEIAPARE